MENGITRITEVQTMTSLEIAQLTGKEHRNIVRDIRNLIKQGVNQLNFEQTEYKDAMGRMQPCYKLTKKGCLILASGYDAVLREKIINRWEELEIEKRQGFHSIPQSFSEALMLAAKQAQQIENQQKQLEANASLITAQQTMLDEKDMAIHKMSKKVSYLDQILSSHDTVTTTQIAQDYGMSAKKFNILLRDLRVQHKVGGQWILYAPYHTKGYVHSETFIPENSATGKVIMNTKWTQKGRLFLYEKLKSCHYLPLIER